MLGPGCPRCEQLLRLTGQAAEELGISVRTLRNKLHLYHDLGVKIPG